MMKRIVFSLILVAMFLVTGCGAETDQAMLEETASLVDALKQENASLQTDLSVAQSELAQAQSELTQTQGALAQAQAELESTDAELQSTQQELDNTQQELDKVREEILIPQLKEEAAAVSDSIDTALSGVEVSLAMESGINNLRSQYDALSAGAKGYVDNYPLLTAAEAAILELYANQSEAEKIQAFKDSCQTYTYDEIARNPSDYMGENAKFRGEVIQIQESGTDCVMRVNVTQGSYGWSDTIYATYTRGNKESRILEDDIITMWGTLQGTKTYTTVLGASVTIPEMSVKYITVG